MGCSTRGATADSGRVRVAIGSEERRALAAEFRFPRRDAGSVRRYVCRSTAPECGGKTGGWLVSRSALDHSGSAAWLYGRSCVRRLRGAGQGRDRGWQAGRLDGGFDRYYTRAGQGIAYDAGALDDRWRPRGLQLEIVRTRALLRS